MCIGRNYGMNGFGYLNSYSEYDHTYFLEFSDGYQLTLNKLKWGAYDIYCSQVVDKGGDTLFCKKALIGFQIDTTEESSLLRLRNSNIPLTIEDSVNISGNIFSPSGYVKKNIRHSLGSVSFGDILTSADTTAVLDNIEVTKRWMVGELMNIRTGKLIIRDTISNSFSDSTIRLSADTVVIEGMLSGNIIVAARRLEISYGAALSNVILIGSSLLFPDNFNCNVQVFATKNIIAGANVTFNYPSVVALLPDTLRGINADPNFIKASDTLTLKGELYAFCSNYNVAIKTSVSLKNCNVTGCLYSINVLNWTGICKGSVICDRIFSGSTTIKANSIRNVAISPISRYYSFCSLFPFKGKQKIVAWLK